VRLVAGLLSPERRQWKQLWKAGKVSPRLAGRLELVGGRGRLGAGSHGPLGCSEPCECASVSASVFGSVSLPALCTVHCALYTAAAQLNCLNAAPKLLQWGASAQLRLANQPDRACGRS